MIDRENRQQVIKYARLYLSGQIDNDSLDELMFDKIHTKDIGLQKVMQQLWHSYDDMHTHYNRGKQKLSKEHRSDIARHILFLQSDFEYKWPEHTLGNPMLRFLSYVLTLGILPYFLDKQFANSGPLEIWPFFTVEEYNEQLKKPVYLSNP
jgi:hypothetical protein